MAKLRDIQLTPLLNEQLVRLLESVPDAALEVAVHVHGLPGGFTKAPAIRKRLTAMIQSQGPLPDWVQDLLAIPGTGLVELLSTHSIQVYQELLADALGPANLTLALLRDSRDPVRQIGVASMQSPRPEPTPELVGLARTRLVQAVELAMSDGMDEDFVPEEQSQPAALPAPPAPPPALTLAMGETEALLRRMDNLEEEIRKRNRYLDNAKKRHKSDKHELEAALKASEEKVAEERTRLREQLEQERTRTAQLAREIDALKSNQARAIADGVEEETSFLKRSWLATAQSLDAETASGQAAAADLLAHASRVIQLQAGQDRHTGNRLTLQRRLEDLHAARARVADTLEHALHPLPELRRVLESLEAEIQRLQTLLGTRPAEEPLTSRLLQRVNLAATIADLGQVEALVRTLADQNLLAAADQRRLHESIYRKYGLLEDRTRREDGGPEPDLDWSLRRLILHNRPIRIYVDGHNLLFSLHDEVAAQGRIGEAEARARLIQSLSSLLERAPSVTLTAFFDGPDRHTESITPTFRVEYSGGSGPHRADHRIAEELEFRAREPSKPRTFVVSNDRAVRQCALAQGARFVSLEEFAALLPRSMPA